MTKAAIKSAAKTATKTAPKSVSNQNNAPAASDSMLREFFVGELKDILWAEKAILKALPKMIKAATSTELQDAFQDHITVTEGQVERLNKAFSLLDEEPKAKKCDAMDGILKEGESIIEDTEEGTATRDVGLVLAAQKVEHYEISTYGGLAQLARTLGEDDVAELLEETLAEEKETDETLTAIAENDINYEAADEDEEDAK